MTWPAYIRVRNISDYGVGNFFIRIEWNKLFLENFILFVVITYECRLPIKVLTFYLRQSLDNLMKLSYTQFN